MSLAASSRPAPHVLEAVLERLTYVNEETGYTVLVGSRRALAAAVRTVGAGRRHTALTHRLAP